MFKANLAWNVMNEALDTMERQGMIRVERSRGVFISLTQEGYDLLHKFSEVESAFRPQLQGFTGPIIATSSFKAARGDTTR